MNAVRTRDRRRGVVLILMAIALLMLVGFVGLALDTGVAALTLHQIQNASDAAALAGARILGDPNWPDLAEVRTAAVAVAEANRTAGVPLELDRNDGNAENGDIVIGRYERLHGTFRATEELPNAVLVNGRRTGSSLTGPVPLLFGPIFDTATVNLARYAIAMNQSYQVSGAGFLVLCPDCPCALDLQGTVVLTVTADPPYSAAIQVNSNNPHAVCTNGSFTLNADELDIVGDNPGYFQVGGSGTMNADINPGSPPKEDPLGGLPAPTWGTSLGGIKDSGTYGPGYYAEGMRLTSGQNVTLLPGVYVFDHVGGGPDSGVVIGGSTNLTANGVLFYVIGSGKIDLAGTGNITISPSLDENDPYYNVSIFQARSNENGARIIGTSNMDLSGVFYFPRAQAEIGGVGGSTDNMVIAWTFYIHGNATIHVAYGGEFPMYNSYIFLVK
jgi:hypothetical protein